MKKIIFTTLIFCSLLAVNTAYSQYCNGIGPTCTPANSLTSPGFEAPDSVPCIVQGVYYNQSIQFKMFNTFDFLGHQTVDSIQFDQSKTGIGNLPCGLCWSTSKPTNRFLANEYGCINISGVTNDPVGQYLLQLTLVAWINENGQPDSIPYNTVNETGIRLWVKVVAPESNCPAVNTNDTAFSQNLTANTGCPLAINEVTNNISGLTLSPNPLSTSAELKFNSAQSASYTLHITDITGRLIMNREIQSVPGNNVVAIEKGDMVSGIYFLSLIDGKSAITRKFTVIE